MPSKEYEKLHRELKSLVPQMHQSVKEARLAFEECMDGFPPPRSVLYHPHIVEHIPIEFIVPKKPIENRVILFLHGGSFNVGCVHSHACLMGMLADKTKTRVVGIDYRLAPEHPFPCALEDTMTIYRWLLTSGYEPSQIILVGNSAGSALLLSLLLSLKEAHKPMPHAGVCISPWVDLTLTAKSLQTNADKDYLPLARLKTSAEWYLAGKDPKTPLASPLFGDLTGLPPLLIHVGSHEILLDDARSIAKKAEACHVDVSLEIWEGLGHSWHLFASTIPEGEEALDKIADWIAASFHKKSKKHLAAKN